MRKTCYESNDYLPLWLDKAEENYPQEIIGDFFNAYALPDCRLYLWQMLKWYGREKDEEIMFETADCVPFFEKLICLVEAAYIIQQQEQKAKTGEVELAPKGSREKIVHESGEPEDPLTPIINMIKNSMDAEKIFLLGRYPSQPAELGDEYDLLVLSKDNNTRCNDELESLVHNRSHDMAPVNAIVFKMKQVNEMIVNGNYFFSTFCVPGNLVYDAGRIEMERTPAEHTLPRLKILNETHQTMIDKANGFLAGAINFYEKKEFSLTAFMLHQSVEHGLNALLVPLLQFRLQTHNLHKLMRFVRRFSWEIFNLFPRDTINETNLFQLLQKAYIHARYKDSFQVSEQEVEALLERVKQLLQKVTEEFSKIVHSIGYPPTQIEA